MKTQNLTKLILCIALATTVLVFLPVASAFAFEYLNTFWDSGFTGRYEVAFGDLDADGDLEAVVCGDSAGAFSTYNAFHHDGTPVGGLWPMTITTGGSYSRVAIAELDGNTLNGMEVVITNTSYIHVFYGNGALWWQEIMGSWDNSTPAIGDLDGDGDMEVVAAYYYRSPYRIEIHAWQGNGTPMWTKTISDSIRDQSFTYTVEVVDLDQNPLNGMEVVYALYYRHLQNYTKIYAWLGDGTVFPNWPISTQSFVEAYRRFIDGFAVGDIDPDYPGLETVVTARSSNIAHLFAFHSDGTMLTGTGWPIPLRHVRGLYDEGSPSIPKIADLDGDGFLDVIVSTPPGVNTYKPPTVTSSSVLAWRGSGTELLNVSVEAEDFNAPLVTDLDGDGTSEIFATSNTVSAPVYGWHGNGGQITNWPKFAQGGFTSEDPIVADVNQDGFMEVIAHTGSGRVYVWTVTHPVSGYVRRFGGGGINGVTVSLVGPGPTRELTTETGPGGDGYYEDIVIEGSYTIEASNPIESLAADFTAYIAETGPPFKVKFTSLSTGNVTGYSWDFGDSIGTSTAQNPDYTYATPGKYTVSLTVTDGTGNNSKIVDIYPPPNANYTPLYINGDLPGDNPPYTQAFTNTSNLYGAPATYHWDFDDFSTSTEINPTHDFMSGHESGVIYRIVLIVTTPGGTDTCHGRVNTYISP